jgi:hypothetical protein
LVATDGTPWRAVEVFARPWSADLRPPSLSVRAFVSPRRFGVACTVRARVLARKGKGPRTPGRFGAAVLTRASADQTHEMGRLRAQKGNVDIAPGSGLALDPSSSEGPIAALMSDSCRRLGASGSRWPASHPPPQMCSGNDRRSPSDRAASVRSGRGRTLSNPNPGCVITS